MIKPCEFEGFVELDLDEPLREGDIVINISHYSAAIQWYEGNFKLIRKESTVWAEGCELPVVGHTPRFLWMEKTTAHAKDMKNYRFFRKAKIYTPSIHGEVAPLP